MSFSTALLFAVGALVLNGVYEITMSDGINPETTLTPLGGVDIIVGLGIIR